MKEKLRVAVINSHPIQYFAPLYAYLSRDPNIEVTALYCSDFSLRGAIDPGFSQAVAWNVELLAGYRAVFIGAAAKRRTPGGFWSLICPQVCFEVRGDNYDAVVIHGYNYAVNVIAFMNAKARGIPVLVRSETHLGLQRARWRRLIRDAFLSFVYRGVDGFLSIGSSNRAYYRALGIPEEKIFDVPYTVDNDRFMAASELSTDERIEVRKHYGLPLDKPVVLYASKLMRRKHPDAVIQAMAKLRDDGVIAALFMVGTGEMSRELKEMVKALHMKEAVFGGFINQAELPKVFAASDVFVLPSENEPWGLVVNEAMCAGIPVVVSDEVGCVPDLVLDGINGYHIKAGDVSSLACALGKLLRNDQLRRDMGEAGRKIVGNWNYERCRLGLTAALSHCVGLR